MSRKAKASEITVGSKVEFIFDRRPVVALVVEDRGFIGWKGRRLLRVRLQLTPPTPPFEFEIPEEDVKLAA